MRLLIKKDDSTVVEVKDICFIPVDADVLVLRCSAHLRSDDFAEFEDALSKKTMKRCIVLPPMLSLESYDGSTSGTER